MLLLNYNLIDYFFVHLPPWLLFELLSLVNKETKGIVTSSALHSRDNLASPPPYTAGYSFLFLLLENYGVRKLEAVFGVLISTMALSFAWMFVDAKPSTKELIIGLLIPKLSSRTVRQTVGVVGCVIMPHNLFLHFALVQSREVDPNKKGQVQEALNYYTIESTAALLVSFMINLFVTTVFAKGFYGSKQADSIGLINAGQYIEERHGVEEIVEGVDYSELCDFTNYNCSTGFQQIRINSRCTE